jgi:(5-formylfuran-3-yl)methyl phosphate synthase
MRLLVSVADAADAAAAVAGGADIIDAKDPSRGPLGPVSAPRLRDILATVAGRCPVSVALGEPVDERLGGGAVAFAKLDVSDGCIAAAQRAAEIFDAAIVLVAYADVAGWEDVVARAERSGATGVLLDTCDKQGPGLLRVLSDASIRRWIDRARHAGLTVALAGRLSAEDVSRAAALGADIVGVRGAACDGGRLGRVSADKVRALAIALRETAPRPACP